MFFVVILVGIIFSAVYCIQIYVFLLTSFYFFVLFDYIYIYIYIYILFFIFYFSSFIHYSFICLLYYNKTIIHFILHPCNDFLIIFIICLYDCEYIMLFLLTSL